MDKKLFDQLQDGDPIAVALRGGAGWIHGAIIWRREDVMLIKLTEGTLPEATPFALIFTGEVSALAVPREIEPSMPESRKTGFAAGA
jgi:hypothetical protein